MIESPAVFCGDAFGYVGRSDSWRKNVESIGFDFEVFADACFDQTPKLRGESGGGRFERKRWREE